MNNGMEMTVQDFADSDDGHIFAEIGGRGYYRMLLRLKIFKKCNMTPLK